MWVFPALPPDLGSTYSWGKNSAGQLGLGHTDDRWTPQVVRRTFGEKCVRDFSVCAASDMLAAEYGMNVNRCLSSVVSELYLLMRL